MATESIPLTGDRAVTASSTYTAKAYAAPNAASPLAPHTIERRALLPQDVQIDILYCGVCHTDLHWARNDWPDAFPTTYPCVPATRFSVE
jgi:uncharacterized zinc-type alcohol dehydrogenase-like protein